MSERNIERLFKILKLSNDDEQAKRDLINKDLAIPVKIIGIGQCGVGKTELLRSIFKISEEDISSYLKFKAERDDDYAKLIVGQIKATTKDFFTFRISDLDGFSIEFTDGPGLGESPEADLIYIPKWINKITENDLMYWVIDGSSRDISHIIKNMKLILDKTNFRDKFLIVLNKVDQILLPLEIEIKGVIGWNNEYNQPSKALLGLITERIDDLIEKFSKNLEIKKSQIVACSARKRWNHDKVLDRMLELLPDKMKIKASRNREIKDFTELMSMSALKKITGEE
jgi:predicted GTPase